MTRCIEVIGQVNVTAIGFECILGIAGNILCRFQSCYNIRELTNICAVWLRQMGNTRTGSASDKYFHVTSTRTTNCQMQVKESLLRINGERQIICCLFATCLQCCGWLEIFKILKRRVVMPQALHTKKNSAVVTSARYR